MRRILITGGAGFIGWHLSRLLTEEGDVRVDILDNFHRAARDLDLAELLSSGNARLVERDLLSDRWSEGLDTDYDHIYHLAAIIGVAHVERKPFEVLKSNFQMLSGVLEFCRRQTSLKRLLFASTSEIYAGALKHFALPVPTPETAPLGLTALEHPRTSYMLSKIYGEALCLHSGLPVTIIRPHNFFGPRMGLSHVIPELLQRAHVAPDDGALTVYSPSHRRTFCYIEDAVRMARAAAESERCAGQALNIGNPSPEITMENLARLITRVIDKPLTVVTGETAEGSPARRCPDISRVVGLTGVGPVIGLEEGIRRTYEWYRTHIFEGNGLSAK